MTRRCGGVRGPNPATAGSRKCDKNVTYFSTFIYLYLQLIKIKKQPSVCAAKAMDNIANG